MSNNIYNNRIAQAPIENHNASSWIQPTKHLTTFNTGDIVPIYSNEVLAGDNIQMQVNRAFVRMTTPIYPVMDNCYLDIMFFYVPYRLLYDKYPEFLGAKEDGYGIQENEYFLPSVYDIEYNSHDIASYIGAPVGVNIKKDDAIQTLWFKAYAKIYNEYFRDENLIEPFDVKKTYENFDYNQNVGSLSDVEKLQYGKGIAKACKLHDLFTSALPFVQKGPNVEFNFNTEVPVLPTLNDDLIGNTKSIIENRVLENAERADEQLTPYSKYFTKVEKLIFDTDHNEYYFPNNNKVAFSSMTPQGYDTFDNVRNYKIFNNNAYYSSDGVPSFFTNLSVTPSFGFSINELRTAVQMQRFYEQLARGGTRYNEIMHALFGVRISDRTVQRAVCLSRKRFDINMSQVVQTSSSDNVSPQGNTSGISATLCNNDNAFNTSFEEPGVLMGLVVVRTNHTYIQRLPKELSKKRKFDFYYPVFQALGEQAVLNKEIYYSGNSEIDNKVFGYQEAWYEYRYKPSYVSGLFHDTQSSGAYESWCYADYFSETPILNKDFIQENGNNLARTLAVPGEDHFIIDFYSAPKMTRLMPLYSIPGLMDHF